MLGLDSNDRRRRSGSGLGVSAEDLRREAQAMEQLAALLSYGPDKRRLLDKALDNRARADALDGRDVS